MRYDSSISPAWYIFRNMSIIRLSIYRVISILALNDSHSTEPNASKYNIYLRYARELASQSRRIIVENNYVTSSQRGMSRSCRLIRVPLYESFMCGILYMQCGVYVYKNTLNAKRRVNNQLKISHCRGEYTPSILWALCFYSICVY